ncbi:hypothetical protein AB1I92_15645 [Bacillus mobilis]|uniref:Uncharacterized protein n=1 Tax=Bacillus mobilis TaxID=2026190 RepID=A0ABV4RV41_9BACI|nr:hypothetical protein [Bacillus cereus]
MYCYHSPPHHYIATHNSRIVRCGAGCESHGIATPTVTTVRGEVHGTW